VRLALVFAGLALLAGCGGSQANPLPLLPASALPELSSSTQDVGLQDLAAEFGRSDANVEGRITGFVRGRERVFQGESHRFDRVVARTLEFDSAADAGVYVAFFRSQLTSVFGTGSSASPLESEGRKGYLVDAAACACHRAEPTVAAIVAGGSRVTYLEVNGGGAKPPAVVDLLAQAP
jgi:hypothetical protein